MSQEPMKWSRYMHYIFPNSHLTQTYILTQEMQWIQQFSNAEVMYQHVHKYR